MNSSFYLYILFNENWCLVLIACQHPVIRVSPNEYCKKVLEFSMLLNNAVDGQMCLCLYVCMCVCLTLKYIQTNRF